MRNYDIQFERLIECLYMYRENLTLVVERTLFDGSNESDNLGDVTLSIGVVGCDNKKSKF